MEVSGHFCQRNGRDFGGAILIAALLLESHFAAAADVEIGAVGDAAFIGELAALHESPKNFLERRLRGVTELLAPDLNFINIEASITRTCTDFQEKTWQFATTPASVAAFVRTGFNLIALANNHSIDCSAPSSRTEIGPALAEVRRLSKPAAPAPGSVPRPLVFHGVARNATALREVAIVEVRSVRIGMVSIKGWASGARQNVGNLDNRRMIFEALRDAPVDVRILSLHGGEESVRRPSIAMIRVAREFVALYRGDIVLGHHPHVTQGVELLRRQDGRVAAMIYSLGNFLHDGLSRRGDGMLARFAVNRSGFVPDSLALIPLAAPSWRPAAIKPENLPKKLSPITESSTWLGQTLLRGELTRVPFDIVQESAPVPRARVKPAQPWTLASP